LSSFDRTTNKRWWDIDSNEWPKIKIISLWSYFVCCL